MSLLALSGTNSVSGGYEIDNSIMFTTQGTHADSGSYFYDIIASSEGWAANSNAGTNARKCTVSAWVKRTALTESSHYPRIFSYRAGGVAFDVFFDPSSDQLTMYDDNTSMSLKTNRSFRDTSSFYHIVVAVDQTQSTASNRVKVYVNGVQETSWATEDYGNQNVDLSVFRTTGTSIYVGGAANDASAYFNGYISEYNFIDGQQLAPTSFGEFDEDSGIWKPKAYTGSYGTLGHYYNFTVSNDMGKDFSGNGNDSNNRGDGITNGAARQATDTPTNNFCTLNGLTPATTSAYTTEGGTTYNGSWSNPEYALMASTFGVSRGKWYWEVKNSGTNGALTGTGAMRYENPNYDNFLSNTDGGIATYYTYGTAANKIYYFNGSAQTHVAYSSFPNAGTGDIISIALDMDNGKIYFAINNTWGNSGNPATGTNPVGLPSGFITDTYTPAATVGSAGTSTAYYNFGGYTEGTISSGESDANGYGTFEYAPPSGYYALCTKNLAEYG